MNRGPRAIGVGVAMLLGCGAGSITADSGTSSADSETSETDAPPCTLEGSIAGFKAREPVVEDLDGDGHLDVIGLRPTTSELEIAWGDGQGGFTLEHGGPFGAEISGPRRLLVGDIDGDGRRDLVVYVSGKGGTVARLQSSPRVFGPSRTSLFVDDWSAMASAPSVLSDLDGDGRDDLLFGNAAWAFGLNVSTALSDGLGGFAQPIVSSLHVWCYTQQIAAADFDGSGDDEFVLLGPWTCNGAGDPTPMVVAEFDGAGAATILADLEVGHDPTKPVIADFDGDGWLDFAVFNVTDISMFRGLGDGSFEPRPRIDLPDDDDDDDPWCPGCNWFVDGVAGDFDGDGNVELVVRTQTTNADEYRTLWIEAPLGPALVEPLDPSWLGSGWLVGDFDEDGCDDLLLMRRLPEPSLEWTWMLRRCVEGPEDACSR